MGSAVPKAKMRPVSWNALEKIEPFTEEVKKHLECLKSPQRVKVFPHEPLHDETLDKVIMSIWCVCYGGMLWRDAMADRRSSDRTPVCNGIFLLRSLGAPRSLEGSSGRSLPPMAGRLRRHSPTPSRRGGQSLRPLVSNLWETRYRRRKENQRYQDQHCGRQARFPLGREHNHRQRP